MHDPWLDRLSEYIDDELAPAERDALEQHLRGCETCRTTLDELEQVVRVAARATDSAPPRDLWAGIAARIAAPVDAPVLPIEARRRERRRLSFTVPQLAAAATVFLVLGAGGLYLAMDRLQPQPQAAAPAPAGAPVQLVSTGYETQVDAITELEQALAQDRDRLDTATVRVLEQSIATIDRAIADARAAIRQDPSNPFLRRHLDGAMKKKIDILRRAVTMRRAAS